jgi:hypothetical protein
VLRRLLPTPVHGRQSSGSGYSGVVSLIGCQPSRLGLAGTQEDLSGGLAAAARLTDKAQAAKLGHVAFAATESVGRHLRLAATLSALDAERIHPTHVEAMQVRRHGHTRAHLMRGASPAPD